MTCRARHDVCVADPNDPPDQHRFPTPGTSPPENPAPDVVDAEVVDAPRQPANAPSQQTPDPPSHDDEAFRQYQQFLEFQRFQEWQRRYGAGEAAGPPPGGGNAPWAAPVKRPWWKRAAGLLRYKLVRRLLYVFLALLLINTAINHYFGGSDNGSNDSTGAGTPAQQEQRQAALRPSTPRQAIIRFYDLLAAYQPPDSGYSPTDPGRACHLLNKEASEQFARQHRAPDCRSAAQKLHNEHITTPREYTNPEVPDEAIVLDEAAGRAKIQSCLLVVQGGPRLGEFGLQRNSKGGWIIDSYRAQPSCTGE